MNIFNFKKFAPLGGLAISGLVWAPEHFAFGTVCPDSSMAPIVIKNDGVLVKCTDNFKAGDIVVTKCPTDAKKTVCRRIMAVGGEMRTFHTKDGIRRHRIPEGHVWLQGDNGADESLDSRNYGPVPTGLLYGKAVCRMSLSESPHFEVLSHDLESSRSVKAKTKTVFRRPLSVLSDLPVPVGCTVLPKESGASNTVIASADETVKKK